MFKPISIKFLWSEELAIKASKLYYDYDLQVTGKKWIGILFIGLLQFGVVKAFMHGLFLLLGVSTFLVIYWYYFRWNLRKKMILRYFHNSPLANKNIEIFLEEDGLKNDDIFIPWESILKAVKFDDGILVQTSNGTFFFDNKAFNASKERDRFIQTMRKKEKLAATNYQK